MIIKHPKLSCAWQTDRPVYRYRRMPGPRVRRSKPLAPFWSKGVRTHAESRADPCEPMPLRGLTLNLAPPLLGS